MATKKTARKQSATTTSAAPARDRKERQGE